MSKSLFAPLVLLIGLSARAAVVGGLCESDLRPDSDLREATVTAQFRPVDASEAIPVVMFPVRQKVDPWLQNLAYSALGWERDAVENPSRTVTVTARRGTFLNGVFTPDVGAEEILVQSGMEGEGCFDWLEPVAQAGTYQLTHTVMKDGEADPAGTLARCFFVAIDNGTMCESQLRPDSDLRDGVFSGVRMDLQKGVRTPKRLADVLPFVYSSTNWLGDVVNVSAESVARVTLVQLTGEGDDVTTWTDVVPNTFKELVKKPGEGEVKWRARKGVWKAAFDILNNDTSIRTEEAIFDLRNSIAPGLLIWVK